MVAIIFISVFLLPFPFPFFSVSAVIEVGALMVVRMGGFGNRCIHLDPESSQHRKRTVERLKSFASLDSGQTSPVEAELELVHQLLLGEPLYGACVT